jgi:plasmid stabilization system protein ParE
MVKMSRKRKTKWKIIWTEPAVESLSEIVEFISRDSEYYAARVAKAIYEVVESLAVFPLRGRVVPEFKRDDFRELIYQSYRIIYKVQANHIAVLSIVHSSRDLLGLVRKESWEIS